MFKFITERPLWVNILTGIFLAGALFFIFLFSLNWLTDHGKASSVPSVAGKTFEEAAAILSKAGFDVEIQDSIYIDTMKANTVIKQIPEADEVVKTNRTVYLLISRAIPPLVEMPNLVGYSFRNAEMVLKNMDLRVGDTIFKPDFARNAVLEQRYKGQEIKAGTQLRKGSLITLVLGDGVGKQEFSVPDIIGLTYCEAKARLESSGITLGAVIPNPDVTDTCSAYIFKQIPLRFDEEKKLQHIRSGQTMDVWLQLAKPVRDTTAPEAKPDPGYN